MTHKPPLLFLHGAFAGPEVWTRFIVPWFAGRGHRVFAPRLPGPVFCEPRLRDYVRRARIAAESFGEKPVVIGHSLGGFIAQHLAAEGAVSGAVLVGSPGPFGLGPTLMQLAAAPDVLAALILVQSGGGAMLGREIVRRALFTDDTPDEWIDAVDLVPQREPVVALLDGITWDLPIWPFARRVPTLAITGERDVFVPVSDLWSISTVYNAEIEIVPGRGHGLPLDPDWKGLAQRIETWLDQRTYNGKAVPFPPPEAMNGTAISL